MHHSLQHVLDSDPVLRADEDGVRGRKADHLLDLLADAVRLRRRQIDFVDHRNDLEVVMQGEIGIRESLRLDALRRVHNQQRAFTGLQAARDFVGEIDVTRRVDEVQLVSVAVLRRVIQAHCVGLDGDATLSFQVHGVEHLLHHFALRKRASHFEQAVRKSRLPVVDVRDDREVPDVAGVH